MKTSLADYAYTVLDTYGEPLHYTSIYSMILANSDVKIGGVRPEDTLRAAINRDKRFVKVPSKRGYYMINKLTNNVDTNDVEINFDNVSVVYSNGIITFSSMVDFYILFGIHDYNKHGKRVFTAVTKIYMPPMVMKELIRVAFVTLKKYEEMYGVIPSIVDIKEDDNDKSS